MPSNTTGAAGQNDGLRIEGLSVAYAGARQAPPVLALSGVDLHIAPGELVVALGASGCGKSTLLNCIAGFTEASAGRILLNGQPVQGAGADRGVVFQKHALMPWLNVRDNVALGLRLRGLLRAERRTYAATTLLTLPYLAYGLMETLANPGARAFAGTTVFVAFALFVALIAFLRVSRPRAPEPT